MKSGIYAEEETDEAAETGEYAEEAAENDVAVTEDTGIDETEYVAAKTQEEEVNAVTGSETAAENEDELPLGFEEIDDDDDDILEDFDEEDEDDEEGEDEDKDFLAGLGGGKTLEELYADEDQGNTGTFEDDDDEDDFDDDDAEDDDEEPGRKRSLFGFLRKRRK